MPFDTSILGWMNVKELRMLEKWAAEVQAGIIVEMGTYLGRSAYCLAASSPSSVVHCYDSWEHDDDPFVMARRDRNVDFPDMSNPRLAKIMRKIAGTEGWPIEGETVNSMENFLRNVDSLSNIEPHRVSNASQINWDGGEVDLMFIDAAHKNPSDWEYISYWLPFIKKGGWVAGHDLEEERPSPHWPDIQANVDRLEAMFGNKAETNYPRCTVWRIQVT